MQQQVVVLTKAQQLLQHRLGESLPTFLERRYITEGKTLAEVAVELGVTPGAISRWLWQFGIVARPSGQRPA